MAENGRNYAPLVLLGAGIVLLGSERKPRSPLEPNQPPVLIVDETVLVLPAGTEAVFDASASYDPEGEPLTFHWQIIEQPEGASVDLITDQPVARFTSEVPGEYLIDLTISDGAHEVSERLRVNYGAEPYHDILDLLDELEEGLDGVAQGLDHLEAMLGNALSLAQEVDGRLDQVAAGLAEVQEDLQEVLAGLEDLLALVNSLRNRLEQAADLVEDLRSRNAGADSELDTLAGLLEQSVADLAAMEELIGTLYATIQDLTGQVAALQAEIQAAQSLLGSLIQQLINAQSQIQNLQDMVANLQRLVSDLQYLIEPVERSVTVSESDTNACSLNGLTDQETILIHFTQAVRLEWYLLAQTKACLLVPNLGQARVRIYDVGTTRSLWELALGGKVNASESNKAYFTLSPGGYIVQASINPPAASRLKVTYLVPRFLAE